MTLSGWIATVAVAAALGIGGGFYVMHQVNLGHQAHDMKKTIKGTGKQIVASHKTSMTLDEHIALGVRKAQETHNQLEERANVQRHAEPAKTESLNEVPQVVHPDYRLDVGTVRLLNAARAGGNDGVQSVDAAGGSDEESRTPSATTVETLTKSDADLATRYNELATRHNALVDWVEQRLREQAK